MDVALKKKKRRHVQQKAGSATWDDKQRPDLRGSWRNKNCWQLGASGAKALGGGGGMAVCLLRAAPSTQHSARWALVEQQVPWGIEQTTF